MEKQIVNKKIVNIGARLKQRRKEMHIKQIDMAKQLGISQAFLSNVEAGRINCSLPLLIDICCILNVTPDYLILGHMRGNKASRELIDELKMCDEEELDTIKRIVDAFVMKKTGMYA